jgi:hypothetical protein
MRPDADATPTNNWSFSDDREKNPRNGEMRSFASDNSRFGGDSSERDKSFRDDGRSDGFNGNEPFDMSRAFAPNGHLAEEMIREGLMSKSQQFREGINSLRGGFQNAPGFDQTDPLHDSSFSGVFGKDVPDDSIFGKSEGPQQPATLPPTMRAWEDPASTFSQAHSESEQASSAPVQRPEAPAVLTIPRRPGSLFQ